jgi:predicted nucleic acid-binding protein
MSNAESTPLKSTEEAPPVPRLLIDADVLVAGAFSTTGASHLILRLGEFSILQCIAPVQVREEAERNIRYKLPEAVHTFRALVDHALEIFPDPSIDDVDRFADQAHPEDVSILTSAVLNNCQYLITFNTRHYYPYVQPRTA